MIFLDILLFMMIVVCISYCWILNRRIQDLQNSRVEFARMIKELNVSIVKAEANVKEMSELSKITSLEIKAVVDEAKDITAELMHVIRIASDISGNIDTQVKNIGTSKDKVVHSNPVMNDRSDDKFSEEDLSPEPEKTTSYTNNLKNFIQNVVTKKNETNQSLNQVSYYDTLRKINAKK